MTIDQLVVNGDFYMDNSKTMGDIQGNTFGSNTNFQGDSVTQIYTEESKEVFNKAYQELLKYISNIDDNTQRQNAEYIADDLKESYEKEDIPKSKRALTALTNTLGNLSSLATIAQLFGVGIG